MEAPICPKCGFEARTAQTRFGLRHACCDLWSWDGAPLVDADTHEARQAAHEVFDPLWKDWGMSRSAAYKALGQELGLPPDQCHMKLMDEATARRAEQASIRIKVRLLRAKFAKDDDFKVIE